MLKLSPATSISRSTELQQHHEKDKMPPKGTTSMPMRLPPLPKLRVRRPNQSEANPCLALMTSVLSTSPLPHPPLTSPKPHSFISSISDAETIACWASSGYNVAGCQALETQLRTCMDTPVSSLFLPRNQREEGWG
jgi:hypothetical protein